MQYHKIHNSPSVTEAAALIRDGALSPEDLVRDALERIDSWNDATNAFCTVYAEQALSQARSAAEAVARGERLGALHGIPIGVKDLFYTAGLRTTRGSRAFEAFVPDADAPIIERVKAAGAILIGKTTTPEFGWTAASTSRLFGPTRNPWNPALTTGGSSSGSAAAVAARMVPATLGTDGGGSVRVPAAFCGIFAMKGSLGRIPVWPWSATEALSHAGPMTLTVADSAYLFDVLKGPHPKDHGCLPDDGLSYCDEIKRPVEGMRVAYVPSLFGTRVDSGIAAQVASAARVVERELDCHVDLVEPDWPDPFEIFETIWVGGRGVVYGRAVGDRHAELDPGFAHLIDASRQIDLQQYLDATRARAQFSNRVQALLEQYDLLIMPSVPILPFPADRSGPETGPYADSRSPVAWARWTPFSYPFNLTGNPAASLPCGWSDGLPVGLQVVGRRFDDASVLRLSAAFEEARPWRDRKPDVANAGSDSIA